MVHVVTTGLYTVLKPILFFSHPVASFKNIIYRRSYMTVHVKCVYEYSVPPSI